MTRTARPATRRCGVQAGAKAGSCAIDVVDTGPGIRDAERLRIFEEFYGGDG